jgi:hypothetical protein
MATITTFPRASFRDDYLRELPIMPTSRMSINEAKSIVRGEAFQTGYGGMHLDGKSAWKTERRMTDAELAYAVSVASRRGAFYYDWKEPFILTVGTAGVIIDPQSSPQ